MGTFSGKTMSNCRCTTTRRSPSRFIVDLLNTLIILGMYLQILLLATFTSASPTQRREISALNDPTLYHGAIDSTRGTSELFKRGTVGDDISNTFDDIFNKVKDVFTPDDDKKTTAVDIVSEYAYDQVDHGIPLEGLKKAFGKLYDDMERGGNETAEHDWIYNQIKDTIPALIDVYEQASKTESSAKKRSVRSSATDSNDSSLDLLNNDSPADGIDHNTLTKRRSCFPCPEISENDNNTLRDAFNEWQRLPPQETTASSFCTQQANACSDANTASNCFHPPRFGHAPEEERLLLAEKCITYLSENPICMSSSSTQWPVDRCLGQLAADGKIELKLTIGQTFKNDLAAAFTQWKEEIAKNDTLPCPSKENACDLAGNASDFVTNATLLEDRQHSLEMCISYLGRHETCFERYQAKEFIKPHLQELAADGKIKGYSKRDDGDNPQLEPGDPGYRTLDLVKNEAPVDEISQNPLKKRTTYACPPISAKYNDTLSAAFTTWHAASADGSEEPCPKTGNECGLANYNLTSLPVDVSEQTLLHFAWNCINYLKLYPVCVGATQKFDFMKPCFDDLAADNKIIWHSKCDNGDKPRPKPGDPDYYTSPGFFPYTMPPTPVVAEDLKISLGNAFNDWQASIAHGHPTCTDGLASCNEADSITTKIDYTPMDERQKTIDNCIKDLIEHPNCFDDYYSRDVLKPYLTELVDQGKIKDEDGKIKNFRRR
jgi:hypothetical protein